MVSLTQLVLQYMNSGLTLVASATAPLGATVDIIAIHGLQTTSASTWTHKKRDFVGKTVVPGINWLTHPEMLPTAIPQADVYTYDWDASLWHDTAKASLTNHADALLAHLRFQRKESNKPLIIIASCFGGLLMAEPELNSVIIEAISGLSFLGTPFRGSDGSAEANWKIFLSALEEAKIVTNTSLTLSLERDNDLLQRVSSSFAEAVGTTLSIPTACFYETKESQLGHGALGWAQKALAYFLNLKKILVSQSSACLDFAEKVPLCATHSQLNKFAGPSDANYLLVKEVLRRQVDKAHDVVNERQQRKRQKTVFSVPLGISSDIFGRDAELKYLLANVPPRCRPNDRQQIAVSGLGGIGKTRLALEVAYRVQKIDPSCSVFWIPATDSDNFEAAYRTIGEKLKLRGMPSKPGRVSGCPSPDPTRSPKSPAMTDFKARVKEALEDGVCSRWLLIIDGMDEPTLFHRIVKPYLPFSHNGSILYTTRRDHIFNHLDARDTISLKVLSLAGARDMLQSHLHQSQYADEAATKELLQSLGHIPLAIRTASSNMRSAKMTAAQYLRQFKQSEDTQIEMMSRHFDDSTRYSAATNPIAKAWWVSFRQISHQSPHAADLLAAISFFASKAISKSLLPGAETLRDEGLATLASFDFIHLHANGNDVLVDTHPLVQLAMRNYLAEHNLLGSTVCHMAQRMEVILSGELPDDWVSNLPHYQKAVMLISNYWKSLSPEDRSKLSKIPASARLIENEEMMTEICLYLLNQLAFLYASRSESHLAQKFAEDGMSLAEQCLLQGHISRSRTKLDLAEICLVSASASQARLAQDLALKAANELYKYHGKHHPWVSTCEWIRIRAITSPHYPEEISINLHNELDRLLRKHATPTVQRPLGLPALEMLQAVDKLAESAPNYKTREVLNLAGHLVDLWSKGYFDYGFSEAEHEHVLLLETAANVGLRHPATTPMARAWLEASCKISKAIYESSRRREPLNASPLIKYSDVLSDLKRYKKSYDITAYVLRQCRKKDPAGIATAAMWIRHGFSQLNCQSPEQACAAVKQGLAILTTNCYEIDSQLEFKLLSIAQTLLAQRLCLRAKETVEAILSYTKKVEMSPAKGGFSHACQVILDDATRIMEEDRRHYNKNPHSGLYMRGLIRHHPILPAQDLKTHIWGAK